MAKVGFVVIISAASCDESGLIFSEQFKPMETEFWELGIDGCILRLPLFM